MRLGGPARLRKTIHSAKELTKAVKKNQQCYIKMRLPRNGLVSTCFVWFCYDLFYSQKTAYLNFMSGQRLLEKTSSCSFSEAQLVAG